MKNMLEITSNMSFREHSSEVLEEVMARQPFEEYELAKESEESAQYQLAADYYVKAAHGFEELTEILRSAKCWQSAGDVKSFMDDSEEEAIEFLDNAYRMYVKLDENLTSVEVLKKMSDLSIRCGDYESAVDYLGIASVTLGELNRKDEQAHVHRQMAEIFRQFEDFESAEFALRESIAIYTEMKSSIESDFLLDDMASMYWHEASDLDAAARIYKEMIIKVDIEKNIKMKVNILNNLANLRAEQGDKGAAREIIIQAVELCIDNDLKEKRANLKWDLGLILWESDRREAKQNMDEALSIWRESEQYKTMIDALETVVSIELDEDNYNEAEKLYMDILNIYREAGDIQGAAQCYMALVDVFEKADKNEKIEFYIKKAAKTWQEANSVTGEAACYWRAACLLEAGSKGEGSIKYYKAAMDKWNSIGDNESVADCFAAMAFNREKMKDFTAAEKFYNAAIALWTKLGENLEALKATIGRARAMEGMSQWDKACILLENNLNNLGELGENEISAEANLIMGRCYMNMNDDKNALMYLNKAADIGNEFDHIISEKAELLLNELKSR